LKESPSTEVNTRTILFLAVLVYSGNEGRERWNAEEKEKEAIIVREKTAGNMCMVRS
jgi:hypothetical protein